MNTVAELPQVPTPVGHVSQEQVVRLNRLLAALLIGIVAVDSCLWEVQAMGLSIGILAGLWGVVIFFTSSVSRKTTLMLVGLLTGAALEATIETGTTNTLVLLILLIALAGDGHFPEVGAAWARWFSQVVAMAFAPGRIPWLVGQVILATFRRRTTLPQLLLGGSLLCLPAVVLALLFGSLLASGNAVFGSWTGQFFDWFWNVLGRLFDPGRVVLWAAAAFFLLPFLRPTRVSPGWWNWLPRVGRLQEWIPTQGAIFSSAAMLLILNLLFFGANLADALFLWNHGTLPKGVTYSAYVHNGVETLSVAVLLSACVLTWIFQQDLKVAGVRGLKLAGLVWIAQNVFLILSCMLRLKLYIEAYDMTVYRLGVILFLILVALGYALLAIKIVQDKSLPWLMGGCALVAFGTLYITQFLNLAGWSANYNVAQWEKSPSGRLDVDYLSRLGPAGWPALRRAEMLGRYPGDATDPDEEDRAHRKVTPRDQEDSVPRTQLDSKHWREFSLRAYWNRWALEQK